jgi:hypothetical protein
MQLAYDGGGTREEPRSVLCEGLLSPTRTPSPARARKRSVIAKPHLECDVLLGEPLGGELRHGLAPHHVGFRSARNAPEPSLLARSRPSPCSAAFIMTTAPLPDAGGQPKEPGQRAREPTSPLLESRSRAEALSLRLRPSGRLSNCADTRLDANRTRHGRRRTIAYYLCYCGGFPGLFVGRCALKPLFAPAMSKVPRPTAGARRDHRARARAPCFRALFRARPGPWAAAAQDPRAPTLPAVSGVQSLEIASGGLLR